MADAAPGDRGVTGKDRLRRSLPGTPAGHLALKPSCWLTRQAKEMPVTATPDVQLTPGGQPRLAAGRWRVDPAHSHASFAARVAGRAVRGCLPLTGGVLIAEPIEDSTARLAARTSAVSTGSPVLDRLLAGPGFLDAGAFPEISFRSELLVWVPDGWRAVGRLRVKDTEHELACQLDLHLSGTRPGGPPRVIIASSWVIDSRWVTSQWIPGLSRRIVMTCSFCLEPDM
jgi:polyisoprenoid-binding protein YceI